MVGMIHLAHRALKTGSRSQLAAFTAVKRCLCSDGRYVGSGSPNVFVEEGNQEGQAWPPVTQEGFVPAGNLHGHAQIPPTHGGFVESYVPGQVQGNVEYGGYATNPYSSPYSNPGYGHVPPQVPLPPPPTQVPYSQVQGHFVGETPWPGMYQHPTPPQVPYVYGQTAPVAPPPVQDQSAYMYQQHIAYTQPSQPPPYGHSQSPGYQVQAGHEGYQHVQQAPVQPEGVQHGQQLSYDGGIQQGQQASYHEGIQRTQHQYHENIQHAQEQPWAETAQAPEVIPYVQSPEMGEPLDGAPVQAGDNVVHLQTETTAALGEVASGPVVEHVEAPPPVETESAAENDVGVTEEMQVEQQVEVVAGETPSNVPVINEVPSNVPVNNENPSNVTAEAPREEILSSAANEVEREASEDRTPPEYDPTAAAMAEAGVSSEEVGEAPEAPEAPEDEDNEQKAETVEREAPEEPPVKGLESLLEVETSKAAPAPPPSSQNESFLELLSKTNQTSRQRPRMAPPSFRSQRRTYAKLFNLPRQILKTDILNYFSELNLNKENIHITYDEKFYPLYAQVEFESTDALRSAQKILQTKGRFGGRVVRMEQFIQFLPPVHPQLKDSLKNYLGRMLLMLHLPPEGRIEDLERFFDGYGYDPSAMTMLEPINMTLARFPKEGNRPVRRAAVGFFSSLEAMRALRERQGDFVLNEPIELRLIQ